jgi:hypothetical protein
MRKSYKHKILLTDVALKRFALKVQVLTYYGKQGHLQCCWSGCKVMDPDCLSLDHILDNGTANKLPGGRRRGGDGLYRHVISKKFPPGLQTLCLNHQCKKELLRRRLLVGTKTKSSISTKGK